jgi:hypothetical protein
MPSYGANPHIGNRDRPRARGQFMLGFRWSPELPWHAPRLISPHLILPETTSDAAGPCRAYVRTSPSLIAVILEAMNAAPSLEILHAALGPVEDLRGDHSQLESTVRESLAELETLHDELTQWQRDLTRQQAELDQRAAAAAEQCRWGEQLRELCRLVERQGAMLESLGARAPEEASNSSGDADDAAASRSQATRRTA